MEPNNRELTLTRVFNAPRELVFKAWTDEKLLAKWWGPRGFSTPVSELDAQPGGRINIVMEDTQGLVKQGSRYPMEGAFQEIVEPERLVFTSSALMDGKPIIEQAVTVTFEEQDGKTTMTVHVVVTKAAPEAEGPLSGMEAGWSQSLDKLMELIEANKGV
jgi:uncharacterized protein YndB with AHSA1/START domain